MRTTLLSLLLAVILLASCRSSSKTYAKYLNRDSLPTQLATIDNTRDTTLATRNGAFIRFVKGSFSAPKVRIQIKEAYSIDQMIFAGLLTESGGKPLSSGGMIYINTVEPDVRMIKPVSVAVPANFYDDRMQVYKGEEKDGKLDWTDPRPLSDSAPYELTEGRAIFEKNCTSCHALDKVVSAPALLGVRDRGPWCDFGLLLGFTRHAPRHINSTSYTRNLVKIYGSIMPTFENLSDRDIDLIYRYIANEEQKRGMATNPANSIACMDSCRVYDSLYIAVNDMTSRLEQERDSLIDSNGMRINFNRQAVVFSGSGAGLGSSGAQESYVGTERYNSIYYQFDIQSPGWYNIDYDPLPDAEKSVLKVNTPGNYKYGLNVFIAVPSKRIFAEGGSTGQENTYAFYETNGKVSIRPGTDVIVFAIGEDEGGIVFDSRTFTCQPSQTIVLKPVPVSKEEFNKAVRAFNLDGVSIDVKDSKNAANIRSNEKEMSDKEKLLESYRPKKCRCDCGWSETADSTSFR